MPIELVAVLAGVKAIEGIVGGSLKVVDSIRSRFGGNDDAKQQLDAHLVQLQANLANVGKLGEAAAAYLDALKEVRHLQLDLLLVDQYLDFNSDPLQNHLNPGFASAWSAVDQLVDTFDRDRDLPRKVQLARKEWFDIADDQMLTSRFNDVSSAFVSVQERSKGAPLRRPARGSRSARQAAARDRGAALHDARRQGPARGAAAAQHHAPNRRGGCVGGRRPRADPRS